MSVQNLRSFVSYLKKHQGKRTGHWSLALCVENGTVCVASDLLPPSGAAMWQTPINGSGIPALIDGAAFLASLKGYKAFPDIDVLKFDNDLENVTVRVGSTAIRGSRLTDFSGTFVGLNLDNPRAVPVEALARVASHIGQDETRVYLNGAMFQGNRVVATDGHRLACVDIDGEEIEEKDRVILPDHAVKALGAFKGTKKAPVSVSCATETNGIGSRWIASVVQGDFSAIIAGRAINGQFPQYDAVIPRGNNKTVLIDRDALRAALAEVAKSAQELGRGVRFTMTAESMNLHAENPTKGLESRLDVPCLYDGESLLTGFNAKYLMDAIASVEDSTVSLAFSDAFTPVLITDGAFRSIVMPMRI